MCKVLTFGLPTIRGNFEGDICVLQGIWLRLSKNWGYLQTGYLGLYRELLGLGFGV